MWIRIAFALISFLLICPFHLKGTVENRIKSSEISNGMSKAQIDLEPHSMLYQAEWLSKVHNFAVAKAPSPSLYPQTQKCLNIASIWFSVDLNEIESPAFETLNNETLWNYLREIGVQGVYLKGLKQGGQYRTGIGLDPKWGISWGNLSKLLGKKGIVLIGDAIGNSTGLNADFFLALMNQSDYPGLYHLIEIAHEDWKILPPIPTSQMTANIPWLTLQELHKRGYVPEQFSPYVKRSQWNATSCIDCSDGKPRRWIYLKENESNPVIDWLNPSFAGFRIATADTLDSICNLNQKIFRINANINLNAKETMALWTRKLGSFSVSETKGGMDSLKQAPTDLMTDTLTRPALLHALISEDAEALKLMYRLYLDNKIETKGLVHILQPFDSFICDWALFLQNPQAQYPYYEQVLTGDALRARLIKQDIAQIGPITPTTWPVLCMAATGIKDFEKKREQITQVHLLLALFYAMQPGVFSFSVSDLLGTLKAQTVNLVGTNENTIYPSLPGQMKNPKSFAMQLRKILDVRKMNGIESGQLIHVPETKDKGLMVLIHRLDQNRMIHLLAINFGRTEAKQSLELSEISQTTAIDLITGLSEKKPLESATIELTLPPLSGKVILFQPKYYE